MLHNTINLNERVAPVIKQAGAIVLSHFRQQLTITTKNDTSLVTQADLASEQYLKQELATILPEASFTAEESGSTQPRDYCWVIDPLDGTTNFTYGLPHFCISIALTYKGTPLFGMIYQPVLDELFYAQTGYGAYVNGKPIRVADAPHARGVILIELPIKKSTSFAELLGDFEQTTQESYSIRHLGAAALDLAYTAAGHAHGVLLENLAWWDVAAGVVILQEAGAIVTNFQGKPVSEHFHSLVAGGPKLHAKLLKVLMNTTDNQY